MGRAAAPRPFLSRLRAAHARRVHPVGLPPIVARRRAPGGCQGLEAYGPLAVAAVLTVSAAGAALAQGPVAVGPEFVVNTYTTNAQWGLSVAMDTDGDFVVSWTSLGQDGSDYGVYAQRYDASGTRQGPEFRVNTYTTGKQLSSSVAMDADGDFVIAWTSGTYSEVGQDGSEAGVYAQRYDASGTPQGSEFRVNTFTSGQQISPTVAMDSDGDFAVAWTSGSYWSAVPGQDGSLAGVYAQRYNSSGVPQGSEFRVNTFTPGSQNFQSVAIDADGDFVVAWNGRVSGLDYDIYAQRYNASGVPHGGEFRVNTYTVEWQHGSSVAMDADGDFVIAWDCLEQYYGGGQFGIYAQRYDASGAAQGGEFRVNTDTEQHYHQQPSAAMNVDGAFVVAWHSLGQDGSERGVYAQSYDASGAPQGGEFRVNTYTTGEQRSPAVALDADGDFVVAWSSGDFYGVGPDGSSVGAAAQRYASVGVAGEPEPGSPLLTLAVAPSPLTRGAGAVRYAVPEPGPVRLALYDALGRQVAVFADGHVAAGAHEAALDSARLPPGVYLLSLEAGGQTLTRTVTVVR